MNAGSLRHIVVLQEKRPLRDAMGGEIITFTNRGIVSANAVPLAGRELFAAQQIQPEVSVRFEIRFRPEVRPEWRVVWQDRIYDVLSVIDVEARGRELHLLCRTGVKSA